MCSLRKLSHIHLCSLFVFRRLLWLHVEKVHLASKGGQEVQDQTMFGDLQQRHFSIVNKQQSIQ